MIFECEFGIVVAFINMAKPCNSRRSSTLVLISTVGENKQNLSCPIPGFIANTPSKSPSRQTTLLPFLRLIMVIESLKLFKIGSPGFRWLQFPEFDLSQSQCLMLTPLVGSTTRHGKSMIDGSCTSHGRLCSAGVSHVLTRPVGWKERALVGLGGGAGKTSW